MGYIYIYMEKGHIPRPRHSTHKNENFVNKFKGRICIYMYIYRWANGIYIYIIYAYRRANGRYTNAYPKKLQFAAYGQFVLVKLDMTETGAYSGCGAIQSEITVLSGQIQTPFGQFRNFRAIFFNSKLLRYLLITQGSFLDFV